MNKSALFARTAMVLALACTSSGGYAKSAGTCGSAESPEPDDDPQEIIVTAQRREQTLIEVPRSISVIGGETLERQQARNFLHFAELVPGFTVTQDNPGETRLDGVDSAGGFPFSVSAALGESASRQINVSTIRPRTIGLIVGAEF